MQSFQFFSPALLDFGAGHITHLPQHIFQFGQSILILRGGHSLEQSGQWQRICTLFDEHDITWSDAKINGEPSPDDIDTIIDQYKNTLPACVVSIGGGSVIDAGKAVSAMLTMPGSVKNYLEKVGDKSPKDKEVPFIAIPTTSGTGSEATKNAVLSEIGPDGFKASLRHNSYIPDIALIDPELMLACPPHVTAAAGMDTLSQLLESYLSTAATPLTDALAISGLEHLSRSFPAVCHNQARNVAYRADMAYAAYLSGLTLANAGLGTVHALAGTLGGYVPLPHGEICGTLLAPVMQKTLELMSEDNPALNKMCRAANILSKREHKNLREGALALIDHLEWLQRETSLNKFKKNHLTNQIIVKTSESSGNKYNPVIIAKSDLETIIRSCTQP